MSGISFMVDERGAKTATVIDLRRHRQVWEDFYDTLVAEARADEPRESLSVVRRRMKLRSYTQAKPTDASSTKLSIKAFPPRSRI
jgi:hypothetical protein